VTIANSGSVRIFGAVKVGRMHVTPVQLAALNRVATETLFTMMPLKTNCRGTLPDIASTFVRIGAYTVRVHGGCLPRYDPNAEGARDLGSPRLHLSVTRWRRQKRNASGTTPASTNHGG